MEDISFAETLKELMEDKAIGVLALAEKIECNEAAIRRWLYGTYLPDPLTLIRLADELECSADYLFGLKYEKDFCRTMQQTTFYQRYAYLRDKEGITDYRVAKDCGIRDGTLSKWKKIKDFPETDSLLKLAKYFHCSLEYLLGRSNA